MKSILVLAALLASVVSKEVGLLGKREYKDGRNITYLLVEKDGEIFVEDLVNSEIEAYASESDVVYYLYTRSNQDGIEIDRTNLEQLPNQGFIASKKTLFIIHGWRNNHDSDVNVLIRQAALSNFDINVIVVDWGNIAQTLNYITARNAVGDVGKFLANLINSLVSLHGLSLNNVVLAGHSLGAHVAGNAGAGLLGQVDHIVGLDAAWPLFSVEDTSDRLDTTDAKFVQVIHTNAGFLGFPSSIGNSDYYPNGGEVQPGCGLDISGACAHGRSYEYFAESISSRLFVSESCSDYADYNAGICNTNPTSSMGGFDVDTGASGNYYLDTNSQPPYAKS